MFNAACTINVSSGWSKVHIAICIFTCARMHSRGRVFGLSVTLLVCPLVSLSALLGLLVHSVHFQGLIIKLTGRSGEKTACTWSIINRKMLVQIFWCDNHQCSVQFSNIGVACLYWLVSISSPVI